MAEEKSRSGSRRQDSDIAQLDKHQSESRGTDRFANAEPAAGLKENMKPLTEDSRTLDDDRQEADSRVVLSTLQRFARSRPNVERCELCGSELGESHAHLLDRSSKQVACSCGACAILFCGQENAKFLRIPQRILKLENFQFTAMEWDAMMLPINLAFFLRQSAEKVLVLYPSPAGVMESLIELPAWNELFAEHHSLSEVQPEVEALLVNRIGDQNAYFIVPIDAAYRLVGLIRTKWRGLSGGPEVWTAIAEFFAASERQATPIREAAHA
jgi:hypothetical protein